jgi:hypothetical protein
LFVLFQPLTTALEQIWKWKRESGAHVRVVVEQRGFVLVASFFWILFFNKTKTKGEVQKLMAELAYERNQRHLLEVVQVKELFNPVCFVFKNAQNLKGMFDWTCVWAERLLLHRGATARRGGAREPRQRARENDRPD